MPSLVLTTNVKVSDVEAFVLDLSTVAAMTMRMPETYISISYTYNAFLTFSGSTEPAFLLTITSLGGINPEANEKYSAALFRYFKITLGVPGDRGYITFADPGRAYVGYKGTTFATIFGSE